MPRRSPPRFLADVGGHSKVPRACPGGSISLNPVRARLVADPSQYPWSRYRAYMTSGGNGRTLVTTDQILTMVDQSPVRQREAYRQFVLDGLVIQRELASEVVGRQSLGSPAFIESALQGQA